MSAQATANARAVILYDPSGAPIRKVGGGGLGVTLVRSSDGLEAGLTVAGDGAAAQSTLNLPTLAFQEAFVGGGWDMVRLANVVKNVAAVAITAATPVTVWTPAAGKKWRVLGFALSTTVAGSIIFKDSGTERFRTPLLVANTPFACPPNMGNFLISAAANNTLQLDLTVTGNVSGFIFGTEE
jgi:hypothetical protein